MGFDRGVQRLQTLIDVLRRCGETFPDPRRGQNAVYSLPDIVLAAFSTFFLQSPSVLAHQRQLEAGYGRSNCQSLFGLRRIPSDNHIRAMLDHAEPALLHPAFAAVLGEVQRPGGLDAFRRPDGHVLIALDGTEYFCSRKIRCARCSHRRRGQGRTDFFHAMLSATLVAPGHAHVLPLEPEFITPQDGAEKQDCEVRAAQRWLAAHGPRHARLRPVDLGDDLFAHQPMCEAVRAAGGHFLFVCKPASHPLIAEYLRGIELPSHSVQVKRGRGRVTHRYRWINDIPLRDGPDALRVNWLEIAISDAAGKLTYRNSLITDLPVSRETVAERAACGRARWKIENETFNVLKTGGYHLEHSFGHGKQNLAALLVSLNLLAFAFHTICDQSEPVWQLARSKAASRILFFSRMVATTSLLLFTSWDELLQTLAFTRPPPQTP
jgi:hypothetical protein